MKRENEWRAIMANRPVFVAKESAPFYRTMTIDFDWNSGFAKVQKQKNITAMHNEFLRRKPDKKILEISSKSMQEYGNDLSAFFLQKYVPELGKKVPVECIFQSAKTFQKGGPYKDILEVSPREAKRDGRLVTSGMLTGFTFENRVYPLEPKTIFYDYIYINALLENEELVEEILKYDAFTDIEFNPSKSINCQAKAAACFVGLYRAGLVEKVKDFDTFAELFGVNSKGQSVQTSPKKEESKISEFIKEGNWIKHKIYGKGKIVKVEKTSLMVDFRMVGKKKIGMEWCLKNCEVLK